MLASDGTVAPAFSSIEAHIGWNQRAYYDVLAEVGGGAWDPGRAPKPWVRFCLSGHYRLAQTILRRMREVERMYGELSKLVRARGSSDQTALALVQAAFGSKVRNSSDRVSADVSKNVASRDLKMLVDAELLVPEGEKRGRSCLAVPVVRAIRRRLRLPKNVEDPFAGGGPARPRQESLFPEIAWFGPRSKPHAVPAILEYRPTT